jgi:hypothetical protein
LLTDAGSPADRFVDPVDCESYPTKNRTKNRTKNKSRSK